MLEFASQIDEAAEAVKQCWSVVPQVGIIFGSGLAGLAGEIEAQDVLDYSDIPFFPQTSALGHRNHLVCGTLAGLPVMAFQGRFHLYEGHSALEASLPVRLLQRLGARRLIVTNATGGLNPAYRVGDVMAIEDQINFMFANPLIGVNDDRLGPRFPDMSAPYSRRFNREAAAIARRQGFLLQRGTYVSVAGPTYETRAEYRMLRRLGGDAVGMSTVPEVLAARHTGMKVLGLSTITNVATPDAPTTTTGDQVLEAASLASSKVMQIIRGVVASIAARC